MSLLLLTDEEKMLAESAAGLLDELSPTRKLRDLRDAGQSHDPSLWSEMVKMGWAGVLVPETHGGAGMGHGAASVLAREMGQRLAKSPFLSTAVIAVEALKAAKRFDTLSAIAQGASTYALAIDETAKFSPDKTALSATPDGNGFRLNGQKNFVADGSFADRLLVLARTSDKDGSKSGLTLFDIDAEAAGISRSKRDQIDVGDAADIEFKDVHATGEDVLGSVDDAMTILRPALEAGQAALAAEMTGAASGAMDMTLGYLKERQQFGVPIGSFQALQHRAAHLWSEIEITASTVLHAARQLDEAPHEATLAVSLAKARAIDTVQLSVREGVQMHGGIGMTDDFDMGFYMKRARVSAEWLGDYGYHAEIVANLRGI